jgi:hypothetical protein
MLNLWGQLWPSTWIPALAALKWSAAPFFTVLSHSLAIPCGYSPQIKKASTKAGED